VEVQLQTMGMGGIPEHNGDDGDADNNGAPSDGDGDRWGASSF
jgi:hypothetical protein